MLLMSVDVVVVDSLALLYHSGLLYVSCVGVLKSSGL